MQNAGTIHWHHVTLVHQSGFAPIRPIIAVPDLAPGEQAKLTASYPAIAAAANVKKKFVFSEWKLFYKEKPSNFTLRLSFLASLCETTCHY